MKYNEWIDIEKPPAEDQAVLLWVSCGKDYFFVDGYYSKELGFTTSQRYLTDITHYMIVSRPTPLVADIELFWSHLTYSVYVKCICGYEVNFWDADAETDTAHVELCQCGRSYKFDLGVYDMSNQRE